MSGRYNCLGCNFTTDRLFNYERHLKSRHHARNAHPPNEEKMMKMKRNEEVTPDKSKIRRCRQPPVKGSHTTTFECKNCNRTFQKSNRARHVDHCRGKLVQNDTKDRLIKELQDKINALTEECNKHIKDKETIYKAAMETVAANAATNINVEGNVVNINHTQKNYS